MPSGRNATVRSGRPGGSEQKVCVAHQRGVILSHRDYLHSMTARCSSLRTKGMRPGGDCLVAQVTILEPSLNEYRGFNNNICFGVVKVFCRVKYNQNRGSISRSNKITTGGGCLTH